MIKIVVLIGRGASGKSKTLKRFFGIDRRLRKNEYIENIIDGKIICAVSLSSPQELRGYCKYDLVMTNILERLNIAKREVKKRHNRDDFIFVIPFGLYMRDDKINEDCIFKPIEWLKAQAHIVKLIYLKRHTRKLLFDEFMARLTKDNIVSREDYDKQAEELRNLIFA